MKTGPIVLLLLLGSACQPAGPLSTPAAASPTEPAPTVPAVLPSPTLAAGPLSGLSPEGPWLVYADDDLVMVNQDGTGRSSGTIPACNFDIPLRLAEDPSNRLAILSGNIYLIQPPKDLRMLAYSPWPACHTAFTGDAGAGLLASIQRATPDAIPELVVYEMPGGKVRSRFSLVKCPAQGQCDLSDAGRWQLKWSPNGRYLAFPAIWGDTASTDLYVYDSQDGSTRQLTSGPDKVAQLWWSPDGAWIIMGEVLQASGAEAPNTTSLWAVSVSTNDIHVIYTLDTPTPQGLLGWLDNEKFVVYDGPALEDTAGLPARNLRVVEINSDKTQLVFNGDFTTAKLDPASRSIMLFGKHNGDQYKQGSYLLSIGAYTVSYLGDFQLEWNDTAGLFVSPLPCKEDPRKIEAFDFSGKTQCIRLPLRPDRHPSPDGQWQVSSAQGVQLESGNKPALSVSSEQATQVIWCPDSKCFFFVANRVLYHVSVPDLAIQTVDEQLAKDEIAFQWLK